MPTMIGWLLLGMVLLPVSGAIVARLLRRRFGQTVARLVAGAAFAAAIACLLALQRAPIEAAALGRFAIFLPSRDVVVARDALIELPTAAPARSAPPAARATASPSPTRAATTTPTLTATATPTDTPTEAPPPTEVPPPPTEAPPPPTQPPAVGPQRYVVEEGDTLRSIANRFDISVEALLRYNGLSPEQGDNLQVGQEILIPPR